MSGAPSYERKWQDRAEILWWEVCGILHDIGKLSSEFLEYRQKWFGEPGGYVEKDPHDHDWLDRDSLLHSSYSALNGFFRRDLLELCGKPAEATPMSVQLAVHYHIKRESADAEMKSRWIRVLQAGDGLDSKYDRNNPLIVNEQTAFDGGPRPEVYRSNVFGYEGEDTKVDGQQLHRLREEFYRECTELTKPWTGGGSSKRTPPGRRQYFAFKRLCERQFDQGMSDTTRPDNDTSLYEHVYAVATLAKAFHWEELAAGEPVGGEREFVLWGVGFEAWPFIAQGHKIGDVVGRRRLITSFFDKVQKRIEFGLAMGNEVYRDEQCAIFVMPRPEVTGEDSKAKKLLYRLAELEHEMEGLALDHARGELGPVFAHTGAVRSTTQIAQLIDDLRAAAKANLNVSPERAAILRDNYGSGKVICPICRVRSASAKQGAVCRVCKQRRTRAGGFSSGPGEPEPTTMVSELSEDRRIALLVVHFGLEEWLNGLMTRTCLVTAPEGIAEMAHAAGAFVDLASEAVELKRTVQEMKLDTYVGCRNAVSLFLNKQLINGLAVSLLGRGVVTPGNKPEFNKDLAEYTPKIWGEALESIRKETGRAQLGDEELLLNALCGKTPTPSTTLDVWRTTEEFLKAYQDLHKATADDEDLKKALGPRERIYLKVRQTKEWAPFDGEAVAVVQVNGTKAGWEAVYRREEDGERLWLINPNREAVGPVDKVRGLMVETQTGARGEFTVTGHDRKENAYVPYRALVVSPDALLMLVPAKAAPAISLHMYKQYRRRFGKVYGRLPLSIGNLYFPDYLPMFSVLDAGWRMVENFRALARREWAKGALPRAALNLCLGTGRRDPFHAYALVDESAGRSVRSGFKTAAGWIAQMEDLPEGTEATQRMNAYHAAILGGSYDRLNLALDGLESTAENRALPEREWRAKYARAGNVQSHGLRTLEELESMQEMWVGLKAARVTHTTASALLTALETKQAEWRALPGGEQALSGFALAAVRAKIGQEYGAQFEEQIRNGLFLTMLHLNLRVMKNASGLEAGASEEEEGRQNDQ